MVDYPAMDPMRRDDIERARRTPPGEKALQTFDLMATGIVLYRAGLRARYPGESEQEIEARVREWLRRDD